MSSFNRRSLILLPLALAACGFTPAYAPSGKAAALLGRVRAGDPSSKAAFDFVERIEERLGRPEEDLYDLNYSVATERVSAGLTSDNITTRYNLKGSVSFSLVERKSGKVLSSGRVENFTGHSATGSTVAGFAAEEDAALRLMRILADQVVTRLIADMAKV